MLELLVCGVPPASIPGVLFATAKATSAEGVLISVPSVRYCREARSILRVLTETLAAYRLGKAGSWEQLFVDGTSRRQVPLQTLLIGILNENDEVMPLMLSAAHILTGESAEECSSTSRRGSTLARQAGRRRCRHHRQLRHRQ